MIVYSKNIIHAISSENVIEAKKIIHEMLNQITTVFLQDKRRELSLETVDVFVPDEPVSYPHKKIKKQFSAKKTKLPAKTADDESE